MNQKDEEVYRKYNETATKTVSRKEWREMGMPEREQEQEQEQPQTEEVQKEDTQEYTPETELKKVDDRPKEKKETRADKFVRLAEVRVNKTLNMFEMIKSLSSSNYEHSDEQVSKIFSVLNAALEDAKSAFERHKEAEVKFHF